MPAPQLNWTLQSDPSTNRRWSGVCCDRNTGTYVLAVDVATKQLYLSNDAGRSFAVPSDLSGVTSFIDCSMSDDGSVMYGVALFAYGSADAVWKSTDRGASWTSLTTGLGPTDIGIYSCDCSGDGDKVVVGGLHRVIVSANGGSSWTDVSAGLSFPNGSGFYVSRFSRDANHLVMANNADVWYSADDGATWLHRTAFPTGHYYRGAAFSDDSATLLVSDYLGHLWLSTDYGATASDINDTATQWNNGICVLNDGDILYATGAAILFTTDSGANWTSQAGVPGTGYIMSVVAAYDGANIIVLTCDPTSGGAVYTSSYTRTATSSPTSSPNPAAFGAAVRFVASVSGLGTPAGSVSFLDGATTLGSAALVSGTASFSIATLGLGTHAITAAFDGSSSLAPSVSPPLCQVVVVSAQVMIGSPYIKGL